MFFYVTKVDKTADFCVLLMYTYSCNGGLAKTEVYATAWNYKAAAAFLCLSCSKIPPPPVLCLLSSVYPPFHCLFN